MINQTNVKYGKSRSAIRELFEYGKKRKAEIGEENVYDFSLGNPSVPAPAEVGGGTYKNNKRNRPRYASRLHIRAGRFFRAQGYCRRFELKA